MPTAAKLIAAVAFAALAALCARIYIPALPAGTQTDWLLEIAGLIGLICGWRIMGNMRGRKYSEAMSAGVRTSVTVVFWALLGASIYVMIRRSTKMIYDGPMDAVLDVFNQMLIYGKLMGTPEFIGAVLIGGLAGGLVTEFAGRRWS